MAQRRKSVMWAALAGVVAVLLFVGGAGAAQLITGADIKNGTVTGKDIKNRSLVSRTSRSVSCQGVPGDRRGRPAQLAHRARLVNKAQPAR